MTALSPRDVWAAGARGEFAGRPLVEHWDGTAWGIMPAPRIKDLAAGFRAIAAAARNDIWAVGSDLNERAVVAHLMWQ